MITSTELFFLDAVRSFLHPDIECRIPSDINWEELKKCAKQHCMTEIIFSGGKLTRDNCPEYDYFYQVYCQGIYRYLVIKDEYQQLATILSENSICFIPFKGIIISDYYSKPNCRTMGDVDILVHPEDKERIHKLLIDAGYINDVHADHEWGYQNRDVYFEVHDHMLHNEPVNPRCFQEYCDNCWKYTNEENGAARILKDDFHFVLLVLHLRKHFMNEGVGYRQFVDLCVMAEKGLDWDWINQQFELLKLSQFAKTIMSLCKKWFGTVTPLSSDLDDSFYYTATKKIFQDGVFGFANEKNINRDITNDYIMSKAPSFLKLPHYFANLFFQPYRVMKSKMEFKYLEHKPFLLPIAWMQRGFRVILNKRETLKNTLVNVKNTKDTDIADAKILYQQWGLLEDKKLK